MSKIGAMNIELEEKKADDMFKKAETAMKTAEKKLDVVNPQPKSQNQSPIAHKAEEIQTLAHCIKSFAEKNHLVVTVNGIACVKAPVWQYIAALLDLRINFSQFADTYEQTDTYPRKRPRKDAISDPADYTYVTIAECVIRDPRDKAVTHGASYASNDEEFLRDKDPYHTFHLAQTRAFVRAMRNKYGYLVAAAGYSTTPFEEIVNEHFNERVDKAIAERIAARKKGNKQ